MSHAIIGVDLSMTSTGLALWTPRGQPTVETISTSVNLACEVRWHAIVSRITHVAGFYADALCVIEEFPFYLAGGGGVSGRVTDRIGLRGALLYELWKRPTVTTVLVNNSTLKVYACGTGRAGKDAMLKAAQHEFYPVRVANDDEADALWLVYMALDHYRDSGMAQADPVRAAALDRVDWPLWTVRDDIR